MKKTVFIKLCLLLFFLKTNCLCAEELWRKDFSKDQNKGYWGTNSDVTGVTDWTLDVSNCELSDELDYVKVVETSGGRLEAVDCDGEAIWKSEPIDISNFTNCSVSVLAAETGTSSNVEKYIKLYYRVDGGAETLFATNAENIGNWGNVEATQSGIEGNELVVIVKLSNPNAGDKVYFDNVLVSGNAIVPERDELTQLLPGLQIQPVRLDTKTDQPEEAISCLQFSIDETNMAKDGNPTKISRMTFYNARPENAFQWKDYIGGFRLFVAGTEIVPKQITVEADSVYLDFEEGQVDVPEAGSLEFDLRCYLNSSNNLEENKKFQIEIKPSAKGFLVFGTGSSFAAESKQVLSPIHSVGVEASELRFFALPGKVSRNKDFSVHVMATDQFGNTDVDASENVELALASGKGGLQASGTLLKALENGHAVFENLQYSIPDRIKLSVKGTVLPETISEEIIVENTKATNVVASDWSPQNLEVSSLSVTIEEGTEVFRFSVTDSGKDNLPTVLEKIRLTASEKNQVNWKNSIEAFVLKRGAGVVRAECTWASDYLDVEFPASENGREILSEATADFSIHCVLKAGKTIDEETFQMQIEALHANWLVSEAGSDFLPEFSGNLQGPEFTMQVKATEMLFANVPKSVNFQSAFGLSVELVDRFGNPDKTASDPINLSLASGKGTLSSSALLKTSKDGVCYWDDLVYSKAENFTIQAESKNFPTILSENVSATDRTSTVEALGGPTGKALNPLATEENNAVPVLRFRISDEGTHDELPTAIRTLKFENANPADAFSWKEHIAGAVLIAEGKILASASDVQEEYIRFYSSKALLEIPAGSQLDCELAIYFKKGQLPDRASIQLVIPKEKHGWKASSSGSQLMEVFPNEVRSAIHFIDVKASQLCFLSYPFAIETPDDTFSLKLAACDAHRNVDTDAAFAIELDVLKGNGELLVADENRVLTKGILELESVKHTGTGNLELLAKSSVGNDTVLVLKGKDELGVDEDFESQKLDNWINSGDWTISSYKPVNGSYSLKHNLTSETGSSSISVPLKEFDPKSGSVNWSFVVRNGDWKPNSGNFFVVDLIQDHPDSGEANCRYSVGVNLSGSNDLLTLWKTVKNENPQVLIESDLVWNENETVAISVSYSAEGNWQLGYNRIGNREHYLFAGEIRSEIGWVSEEWFSALEFHFETSSRAGGLWLDDLRIEAVNTPPFVKSHEIRGDSLFLHYSEALDLALSANLENFEVIKDGIALDVQKIVSGESNEDLVVIADRDFATGNYRLNLSGIWDARGAVKEQESIAFQYLAPAKAYDIVFNEIMADEEPAVELPGYEYLELYNTTDDPVSVENWKLSVGDREVVLAADTLKAKSYLILCSNAAKEYFQVYGHVLGVKAFPALPNSGGRLQLESAEAVIIDELTYSGDWYGTEEKESGGWSLERIDPLNRFWQKENWAASKHVAGGTPGRANSVYANNPDETKPVLLLYELMAENRLQLAFSEPMLAVKVLDATNFRLEPGQVKPVQVLQTDEEGRMYELLFEDDFIENRNYRLSFSEQITDLAGNELLVKSFDFWVPALAERGDLVINEVLFNPYVNGADYVEVFNASEKVIDLLQVQLATRDENFQLKDFVPLAKSRDFLHPGQYVLFSTDTANVAANYFTSDKEVFRELKSMPSYNDKSGRVVLLFKDEVLDDFAYNESMHFELLPSLQGVALERIAPQEETNRVSNWQSAAQTVGFGTPGLQNSVYKELLAEDAEVSFSSATFSPDNDGIDDRLDINFNLEKEGCVVNVRVYNSTGKEIRKLAGNLSLANQDRLFWDGLNSQRERVPIGIYLVYIELFHPEGEVQIFKKACVVAGKLN